MSAADRELLKTLRLTKMSTASIAMTLGRSARWVERTLKELEAAEAAAQPTDVHTESVRPAADAGCEVGAAPPEPPTADARDTAEASPADIDSSRTPRAAEAVRLGPRRLGHVFVGRVSAVSPPGLGRQHVTVRLESGLQVKIVAGVHTVGAEVELCHGDDGCALFALAGAA